MTPTFGHILIALIWAGVGGVLAWLITYPLHRRSPGWLLAAVVATSTAATVAGVVGSVHEMSTRRRASSGRRSPSPSWPASSPPSSPPGRPRRLARDNRPLQHAVAELGAGRVPTLGRAAADAAAGEDAGRAGRHRPAAGRLARARAGARDVPARTRRLGQPRPAHSAGQPAGDVRGARRRRGRRPRALLQADAGLGRPAGHHGRRPVRAVAHPDPAGSPSIPSRSPSTTWCRTAWPRSDRWRQRRGCG